MAYSAYKSTRVTNVKASRMAEDIAKTRPSSRPDHDPHPSSGGVGGVVGDEA